MKELITEYNKRRHAIKERLNEFEKLQKAGDEDLFGELCFCILTPQAKAVCCNEAIIKLKVGKHLQHTAALGDGPVDAGDSGQRSDTGRVCRRSTAEPTHS